MFSFGLTTYIFILRLNWFVAMWMPFEYLRIYVSFSYYEFWFTFALRQDLFFLKKSMWFILEMRCFTNVHSTNCVNELMCVSMCTKHVQCDERSMAKNECEWERGRGIEMVPVNSVVYKNFFLWKLVVWWRLNYRVDFRRDEWNWLWQRFSMTNTHRMLKWNKHTDMKTTKRIKWKLMHNQNMDMGVCLCVCAWMGGGAVEDREVKIVRDIFTRRLFVKWKYVYMYMITLKSLKS